jgi:hypothetical protein
MSLNIDYSTIDFDALKDELISYLKETKSFKDVEYVSSNINTLVQLFAYMGSLFGYYINSIANEPFLPSAKRYKNLNRIARLLNYNPRGDKAATVNAVGSLNPEYCFGKEGVYFQVPAYSKFPSNKSTPDGETFSFTNEDQLVYLVRGFGIKELEQSDFTYEGNKLPLTMPASYWGISVSSSGTSGTASFDPTKLEMVLSNTKPLSILDRLDQTNYKKFDTETAPVYSGEETTPAGQPFTNNIPTNGTSLRINPDTIYYVVFNYDIQTNAPYLTLMEEGLRLTERQDDVIMSIKLEKDDASGTFYTLKQIQNNSKNRFYVGVLGMQNLESVQFSYDKLENTKYGIKQIHLDINKSGDLPPFRVLVDGNVYSFSSGRISSQIFENNIWDTNQPFYNVNLNIVTPTAPEYNYDATLTITSKDPGINEVTVAKIYTNVVDENTGIRTLDKEPGQRFGNLQAIPKIDVTTTEQRTGFVDFPEGVSKILVSFDTPFTPPSSGEEEINYIVELTPNNNVQVWYSDRSSTGFAINVEPEAEFIGKVNWVATRYKEDEVKKVPVVFSETIPEINAGFDTDYTIFLSANDNVRVWYEDVTSLGFKIVTEKQFSGTVSYSTFVSNSDERVIAEKDASTQKKGRITLSSDARTKDITFDVAFPDDTYGLHMVSNKNFNTWYTNKTATGFTVNVEQGFDGQIVIDWFADQSPSYQFQKHGMIDFSGQLDNGSMPGLRFINIPETFLINDLKQGDIVFTYINKNGAIDTSNNSLNMAFAADRKSANEIKVHSNDEDISYTDVRVFVKNEKNDWEEWKDATSETASVNIDVGNKVFFVRVDEYKKIEVTFGDGETYGKDPYGSEIIIFGLKTKGKNGNIPPNTLNPGVMLSRYILGDDNVTINFEQQFIQLVGLKNDVFRASGSTTNPTSVYDSEGTRLTETELTIKQPNQATGGNFVETVEELRSNASTANLRQDRIVSLEDYKSFCGQYFSDYITKIQVLSYKDLHESGFIPEFEMEKYWFNHIFIIALPTNGNVLDKVHKDYILNTLNKRFKAMATVEHELFSAKYVPIDVRIRFKPNRLSNIATTQTNIKNSIRNFFAKENREMGETIQVSQLQKIVLDTIGVDSGDVAINRDDGNKLNASDYDVTAVATAQETVEEVKRRKILEILAKDASLIKIIEPLFDVKSEKTGERKWLLTGNLDLNKYEFPHLGDIIIEVEG